MHRSEHPRFPGRAGRPALPSEPGSSGWLRAALTASLVVGIGLAPGAGRADGASPSHGRPTAAPGPGPGADGATEATRLHGELERLNREIDALKQRRRSLGEDYELRRKMADAEARARRLTELESRRAGARVAGPTAASPTRTAPGPTPGAAPFSLSPAPRLEASDDREVLDAKADILADQARRLEGQAQLLERRVTSLRGRQELRRRARDLEQDPFSPLEQSKRRVPIGSALSTSPRAATPAAAATTDNSSSGSSNTGSVSSNTGTRGAGTAPPPGGSEGNGAPTPLSGPAPNTPSGGATTNQTTPVSSSAPVNNPVSTSSGTVIPASGPGGGGTSDSAGSLALQFRDVLDPTTLMEIRRLEGAGATVASLPATERALAALRARARQLQTEADAARQAAHPVPRSLP
jgi:hypothetical protein